MIDITVNGRDEPLTFVVDNTQTERTIADATTASDDDPAAQTGAIGLNSGSTFDLEWNVVELADMTTLLGERTIPANTDFGTISFPGSGFSALGTPFDAGLASDGSALPLDWSFDPTDAINLLDDGESVVLTYEITATNRGGPTTQNLVITLTGRDDAPVFDDPSEFTGNVVTSDGATGTITVSDIDGDTVMLSAPTNTDYGGLTFTRVGSTDEYEWTLDLNTAGEAALDALGNGDRQNITFEITATGGTGGLATMQTLMITLEGANAAPELTVNVVDDAVTEAGGVNNAAIGDAMANGSLTITDPDMGHNDFAFVGNTLQGRAGTSGAFKNANGVVENEVTSDGQIMGTYGTLTLERDGTWSYALRDDDPDTQGLGGGDTPDMVQDVFNIQLVNVDGTTQTSAIVPITIDVTGANDDPVIADTSGVILDVSITDTDTAPDNVPSAVNQATIPMGSTEAYGNFAATDADGDTITWSGDTGSINADMTTDAFDGRMASDFGALTVNTDGIWSFAPTAAINAIGTGGAVVIDYTIEADDGNGGSDTATLTIMLQGINDAPELTVSAVDDAVTEAGGLNNAAIGDAMANGSLTITDPDTGHNAFTFAGNTLQGRASTSGAFKNANGVDEGGVTSDGQIMGTYGTLTLERDGTWSYALRDDDPDTQALDGGNTPDMVQDVFEIQLVNVDGTTETSAIVPITIDVTGANDAPTITMTDGGKSLTDASADDHIGSASATQTITGTAVASDVDANDGDGANDLTWSIMGTATRDYGTLVFDNSGVGGGWTFTTDADAFNAIAHGQPETITYSVQASDPQNGTSAAMDLTITLEGVNDKPELAVTGNNAGVTEAGGANNAVLGIATVNGSITITDPDTGHEAFDFSGNTLQGRLSGSTGNFTNAVTGTDAVIVGVYGTLTLRAAGTWAYALRDDDPDTQRLRAAQTVQDAFEIQLENEDAGNTQTSDVVTLTVNVTGANDSPVIADTNGILLDVSITDTDMAPNNRPGFVNQNDTNPVTGSAYGGFTATDADGDSISWTATGGRINAEMTTDKFDERAPIDFVSNVNVFGFNSLGTWSLDPTDAINELDTGESVVIDYTIEANDRNGGTDTSILRVRLNGLTSVTMNRDPMIAEVASGVILEVFITDTDIDSPTNVPDPVNQDTIPTGSTRAYGNFRATDPDPGDIIEWLDTGEVRINTGLTDVAFHNNPPNAFGVLMVNLDGTWSFTPTAEINKLNAIQLVVVDYTIEADDGRGGIDTSILRVRINDTINFGPNSPPEITDIGGVIFNVVVNDPTDSSTNIPSAVNQDSNNPTTGSAYGRFEATDDDIDLISWSTTGGGTINRSLTDDAFDESTADFGAFTVDGVGRWSFVPTVAINQLDTGESVVIDYTIEADDGNGGIDTSILRVTLNGTTNVVIPSNTEITEIIAPTSGFYHLPATGQVQLAGEGVTYSVNTGENPDIAENRKTTFTAATDFEITIDKNGIWTVFPTKEITIFSSLTDTTERNFYIHAHDSSGTYLDSQQIIASFNKVNIVRTDGNSGSSGNEFFIGTTGDDNFSRTGGGTDVIVALEGDDTIKLGRTTSDTIYHRFSSSGTDWTNTDGGDTITNYNRNVNTFIFVDKDSTVVDEGSFIASNNIQLWATFGSAGGVGVLIDGFEIRFVDPNSGAMESTITFEYHALERPDITVSSSRAAFIGNTETEVSVGTREITDHRVWGNYFGDDLDAFRVIDDDDLPPAFDTIIPEL